MDSGCHVTETWRAITRGTLGNRMCSSLERDARKLVRWSATEADGRSLAWEHTSPPCTALPEESSSSGGSPNVISSLSMTTFLFRCDQRRLEGLCAC